MGKCANRAQAWTGCVSRFRLSPPLLSVKREDRAGRLWGVSIFRSVPFRSVPSPVPQQRSGIASFRSAFRIVPYRCIAVSPYRRSVAPFLVSGGGASGGKRRVPSRPFRPSIPYRRRRFILLVAIFVPPRTNEKTGRSVSLPSRSRRPLIAVVDRVGDDEVVVAHNIRCARDGKHVVVGG